MTNIASGIRIRRSAQLLRRSRGRISAYLDYFLWWFAYLYFGLRRGPITPPGPAVVLMDRKDLNLKKNQPVQAKTLTN